ncbi:MAG: substrate-binding domain-containing protein [Planctomycetes bacterium]|nr:substrate-binding domain-containing protein [Planctomycetota bacterium]MCB9919772.1 substrate-binding domain-containing protein [Planctomycetota bacterium]
MVAVSFACIAMGTACSPSPDKTGSGSGDQATKARRIAVIPKGTTHEFWKSIHAGALAAGRELGVEILWQGPIKEDDRNAQIDVVESFLAKKVDGIVIAPLDDKALARPLREASEAGIPVVVIDSNVAWDGRKSFIATDNYKGGTLCADALATKLGGKGKVAMLRYIEGSASTEERERGFLEAMANHPGIEIASSNQRGGATTASAVSASETLLGRFGDLQGVFCPNESVTFGMLRALQDSGKAGSIVLVGFDASPKLVEGLAKREIEALAIQDPVKMGELGVRRIVDVLEGRDVPARIDTGVTLVTADSMNEPANARLLDPDLSILDK